MKKVALLLLTGGWTLTLIAALFLHLAYLENEIQPALNQSEMSMNSFPYLQAIEQLFNITLGWVVLVLVGWSVYFVWKGQSSGQ